MTTLFAGTEREALQQAATGVYSESAGPRRAGYSRAATTCGPQTNSDCRLTCNMDAAVPEAWINFYTGQFVGAYFGVEAKDASGNTIARITNGGALQYWNGSTFVTAPGTTFSQVADGVVTMRVCKGAGSAGRVEAYWNENLISDSGPIALTSFGDIAYFDVVGYPLTGLNRHRFFSEVVISDESTLQWGCFTVPPVADGADTDGAGTVADVNELDLNESTFIALSAAGEKRSFTHDDVNAENYVKAVSVAGRIRRVDDTGPQQIRPYLTIEGTRYYGPTFALTTGFKNYCHSWSLNPATGTDWTTADVDLPEFAQGWEAVA